MITSTSNSAVRHIKQLQKKRSLRQKEGVFVVEGLRSFVEIPRGLLVKAFISETAAVSKDYRQVKEIPHEIVSDQVMAYMSETKTSQGFLAIARQREKGELIFNEKGLYLLLEHLQDPGNLGTIMRMSEAMGVTQLLMSSDTVDIYNPKVVRATMGSIFRVPFIYVDNLVETIWELKKRDIAIYGASLEESQDYAGLDYTVGCGFVIGNEANGITPGVAKVCTGRVHIPMQGEVESLNAAVAASVLLSEAYRQKRIGRAIN